MKKDYFKIATLLLIVFSLLALEPLDIFAKGGSFGGSRGGGGFGGSRSVSRPSGSFGGSRSTPSASKPTSSFGGTRTTSGGSSSFGSSRSSYTPSFRGNRMNSTADYTNRYGAPRRIVRSNEMPGLQSNYVVHQYGGMGDGFMMGYIMDSSPWYWRTPFHPAFYYSQPNYVYNEDGTVSVFPPTFSMGSVFLVVIIGGSILFIIVILIKRKIQNKREGFGGSFE